MPEKIRSIRKLNIKNSLSKKEAQSIVEQKKQELLAIIKKDETQSAGNIAFAYMAHILENMPHTNPHRHEKK